MNRSFTFILFITLIILSTSCRKKTEYDRVNDRIATIVTVDTGKGFSFILYQPLVCLGCNGIVSNLLHAPSYTALFGHNSFIVFDGIRENELKDYQSNLENYGMIHAQYINDKDFYEFLQKKTNPKDSRPALIILSKKSDRYFYLDLKAADIVEQIEKSVP